DLDEDLARLRRRLGNFLVPERLRTTGRMNANGFHDLASSRPVTESRPLPLAQRRSPRAGSVALRLEEPLGVDRGHTASACGRDGLAVNVVGDVARGEDPRRFGAGRAGLGDQIPGRIHGKLALEEV